MDKSKEIVFIQFNLYSLSQPIVTQLSPIVNHLKEFFPVGGVGGRFAERFALSDERADRVVNLWQQLEEVQLR